MTERPCIPPARNKYLRTSCPPDTDNTAWSPKHSLALRAYILGPTWQGVHKEFPGAPELLSSEGTLDYFDSFMPSDQGLLGAGHCTKHFRFLRPAFTSAQEGDILLPGVQITKQT